MQIEILLTLLRLLSFNLDISTITMETTDPLRENTKELLPSMVVIQCFTCIRQQVKEFQTEALSILLNKPSTILDINTLIVENIVLQQENTKELLTSTVGMQC